MPAPTTHKTTGVWVRFTGTVKASTSGAYLPAWAALESKTGGVVTQVLIDKDVAGGEALARWRWDTIDLEETPPVQVVGELCITAAGESFIMVAAWTEATDPNKVEPPELKELRKYQRRSERLAAELRTSEQIRDRQGAEIAELHDELNDLDQDQTVERLTTELEETRAELKKTDGQLEEARAALNWMPDQAANPPGTPGHLDHDSPVTLTALRYFRMVEEIDDLDDKLRDTEAERDAAYRGRAELIAVLAGAFNDGTSAEIVTDADPKAEGWPVIYLKAGSNPGQISYHLNPSDLDLFEDIPKRTAEDAHQEWDGHDDAEKSRRLAALELYL